jgi:hypothetical protein
MNPKRIIFATTLALALASFQPATNAGLLNLGKLFGPKPIRLDDAPTPEKSVSADSFGQLKDCKKVVVTAFNVQFITKKSAAAHAGREGEGAAHINSHIILTGLDTPTFQAITDQAYTNFVKGLRTLGLEVMPYAEYTAEPQYADMKAYMKTSPLEISGGMFSGEPSQMFAPTGMPVPIYGDEIALGSGILMAAAMGRSTPNALEPQIAKRTGVAAVHVYLVVDFCQMDVSGGTFSFSTSVKTKPQISIAQISRCSFYFGNTMYGGRELVKMKNHAFGTDEYVTEFKDVTTSGQKVGDAAADLIGAFSGGGTYKTTSYEAVANPALYQTACVKYLTAVQDLIIAGIKTKTAK